MERLYFQTIYADYNQYHYADENTVWNIFVDIKDGIYYVRVFHWYDDRNPNSSQFIRNILVCRAFSQKDLLFKILNWCIPAIDRQRIIHGDEGLLYRGYLFKGYL